MQKKFSPSQIDSYLSCQRKWAWRYIEDIKLPPGKGAALGTKVHEVLERYIDSKGDILPTAEDPEEIFQIEVALSGVHLLPDLQRGVFEKEGAFEFVSEAGVTWCGRIDLRYFDDAGEVSIIDHKTTIDFKWAKSEEDLRTDAQSVIYAVKEFFQNPSLERLNAKWIYYRTGGQSRAAKAVGIVWERDKALEEMKRFDAAALECLDHIATKKRALDLLPNPKHCDSYGGCPYRGNCNLSPLEMRVASKDVAFDDFSEMIRRAQRGEAPDE